ncbi:sodium:solute symporter family protein [Thauera aminoaromatica]|uniref:Cation acetate symporter n=7 Tax=Thauera aminoaromatica TaxID=164330 RepID=C4KA23_THASP|nr:sodium:solute symporter family protein [Thauera aminoaromatica]MDA0235317.1 VC_2705 family sodium/solute symporter [Pseudomonadota bacterium]OPZ04284.1 MAG: Cation/acetate symporter ActP [Alphaproteobacteria bacterium ADurb.BinA305]ACR01249.1 SSS sodium solute transporter superfamily [Thauera aminoaromatica]TXH88120.1 MAG: cation acetate symporter [Thauera aminoaromatica]HNV92079.1 VC_2705 family sodium/solute symporter [Thauera aminoaromatica]
MRRNPGFARQLRRYYGIYTLGFALFVVLLAIGESLGLSQQLIGHVFLFVTIAIYATIGVLSRTSDVTEYYVAGRRVPALFNGMATAADWMSAASFIGLAGTLYFSGFEGLAFVTGWTGGFVLVALLLAPYLRKFGQYTIPDFLGARYQGNVARLVGLAAAVLASFVYLVAQIYGVGLVTSRFVSVEFEIGLFIGLAGILVCSFLGGMRAVTWTQVAQYVILIIAYLVPVVILSYKLTGIPIPQAVYGTVLQQISAREDELLEAPTERAVRDLYSARARDYADKIAALPASLEDERRRMIDELNRMRLDSAPARDIALTERALRDLPRTPAEAREAWQRARAEALERARPPPRHAEAHPGATASESATARNNFLALMFVLMVGTAALPHILMRYYTTPGVMEARRSVLWSLFFIFLLYVTAPAYAVFAKWEVYNNLVGSNIAILPDWVASWGRVGLVRIEDLNGDGILQLAELRLNTDVIVLATPEIAGLPYVVSGLVAAGGLAAALSTADGLLLTISNALSHDLYYKVINPKASAHRRLVISKSQLLVVAVVAAWVASMRPDNILFMVGLAFSIGGSAFFPALVLGIFWKRANRPGAVAGMLAGLAVTVFYVVRTHPFFGGAMANAWFEINPISAGVFGVPLGFATIVAVSLLTKPPPQEIQDLVDYVRYPDIPGQSRPHL